MKISRWILICVCCFCTAAAFSNEKPSRDSLRHVLSHTSDKTVRINLMMAILDLAEQDEDDLDDAMMLYKESVEANDELGVASALGSLTLDMIDKPELRDSLDRILLRADAMFTNTPYEGVATYYQMAVKLKALASAPRENRIEMCNRISDELTKRSSSETQYQKCERLFLISVVKYLLVSMTETSQVESILSSLSEAWEQAMKFPPMAKRNFGGNIYVLLSAEYNENKDGAALIKLSNEYLQMLDEYYSLDVIKTRHPYIYKDDKYLLCYQMLMLNQQLIGRQKAKEYYDRFCKFMKNGKGDAHLRNNLYFYSYSYQYFMSDGQYEKALAYSDSIITQIHSASSVNTQYAQHYKNKAKTLEALGRKDEACDAYETAMIVSDSTNKKQILKTISKIQVEYELDEMKLEKAQLSADIHMTILIFSIMLIIAMSGFSIYSLRSIKRTKKLQLRLIAECAKAEESDKQKTAFFNSVCHEVRTPLNSINGFSELIAEGYAPLEKRKEYAEIITDNCAQLRSLLDDLLNATYLETLIGQLSTAPVDIDAICRQLIAKARSNNKSESLEYIADLKVGGQEVHSNDKFLGIMIETLLNNAAKFTKRGSISIASDIDTTSDTLVITVTDTGCGIPADKHSYVFERFTKIDPFSPGNGLGLYLCRLIATNLGGGVTIDGNYKSGARFIIRLPMNNTAT